jgi:hypothetical protein
MKYDIEINDGLLLWAFIFLVAIVAPIGILVDGCQNHSETMARIQNHCQEPEKAK